MDKIINKYGLCVLLLTIVSISVSSGISLSEVDVVIENQCVNETTTILIYPKTLDNRTAIIDSVKIYSILENTEGDLIFSESGSFIKEVRFSEVGSDIITLNISEQEKTIQIEKEVNIEKCSNSGVNNIVSKFESSMAKNKMQIIVGITFIVILAVVSIMVGLSKTN